MAKYESYYEGELRTRSIHLASGNSLLTDAPVDNHGKGETFSPTDLTAISLITCMLTVMGIAADKHQLKMGKAEGSCEKIMNANPRRIGELNITIRISDSELDEKARKLLEQKAIDCPVAASLHPDILQSTQFEYL